MLWNLRRANHLLEFPKSRGKCFVNIEMVGHPILPMDFAKIAMKM